MTNLKFSNGNGYFDIILIHAGNTFLSSLLRGYWLLMLGSPCISSTVFYRMPSPKSASYCEALY